MGASTTIDASIQLTTVPGSTSPAALTNAVLAPLRADLEQTHRVAIEAVRQQAQECATARGYTERIIHPYLNDLPSSRHRAPWEYPTLENARRWGYTPGSETTDPGEPPPPADDPVVLGNYLGEWSLSLPEAQDAWPGQGTGGPIYDGCLPTAILAIIGGGEQQQFWRTYEIASFLDAVTDDAVTAVLASPQWQPTETAWSTCMRDGGFDTPSFAAQRAKNWNPPFTDQERREAVADVQCMQTVGAAAVGDGLLERQTPAEQYVGLIEDFSTQLDQIRERAQNVLSN